MDKYKSILIILAILLLTTSINASFRSLGTFERDTDIILRQLCDNCTTNNITSVVYPNGSTILGDINMSRDGTEYNYTLNASFINPLGTYFVNGVGDEDGESKIWVYNFDITQSGRGDSTTGQAIIYFLLMGLTLFLFSFCMIGGLKIPWQNIRSEEGKIIGINNFKFVKIALFFFAYLTFIVIFFMADIISRRFLFIDTLSLFFNAVYRLLIGFLLPSLIVTFVFALIIFLQNKKIQKAIIRGIPMR